MTATAMLIIGISVLQIILILLFSKRGGARGVNLTALSNESRDGYLPE